MSNTTEKKPDKPLKIWKIPLSHPNSRVEELLTLLSEDEQKKALQFRFEKHRRRYIVAHSAMRNILASELNIPLSELNISIQEAGKPYLTNNPLYFNLSHSEELAIVGVSFENDIGVDVEFIKEDLEALEIAKRFFHPAEYEQLIAAPAEKRVGLFYTCWTAKEAYLKTKGLGIGHHLKSFALNIESSKEISVNFTIATLNEFKNWKAHTHQPDKNYFCTVVSSSKSEEVTFQNYEL